MTDIIESDEDVFDIQPESMITEDYDSSNYNISNNITKPILNKYEKATILIMRCEQINNGFQPLIENYEKYDTIEEIVEKELELKKIPFIIKRNLRNQFDYWKLSDMVV
jgi:DNA-directed RNA polymerase subunit K/omega